MTPDDSPISQAALDYQRVEQALRFIEENFRRQPSLKEIAEAANLSEYHFDRLFSRWAGTTPQRFLRFLTKEYAKNLLDQRHDLLDVTLKSGLSSPGRLHELFVTFEALSPGEYKHHGAGVDIAYGFHPTPFGECLLGVTGRGVVSLTFQHPDERATALARLQTQWHKAVLMEDKSLTASYVAQLFQPETTPRKPLHLLLRGTNFQIKVWEALLTIPAGQVVSYDGLAAAIGIPTAQRAVGTAIGQNAIGYLIPCHRVIQKIGNTGNYRWGALRKRAMLAWEAAQLGAEPLTVPTTDLQYSIFR
ncbi:MAG: methylated-DNA--[protein]-cysteine S-methyltransferase [Cytophagaceae bacterium]|nr:methylated-DNA--[protein]-cysteine S-methyltransferase [Cytophagaceae bacterium]